MAKLRVFRSASRDIFLNLALEDNLFRNLARDERILFLWSNDPAVVIGRYQNPWIECRASEIERDGIALARRQSGGGTVWHDRGNLCFTFMGEKAGFDRKENIDLVVAALRDLGVDAEVNERLDILVVGRKVSGSAFRESAGKAFHHGTLLVESDLGALARYLAPGGTAHRAKGVKSVRSPVANLTDSAPSLTVEKIESALAAAAFAAWGAADDRREIEELDIAELAREPEVASYRERISGRDWRFAASPPFDRRLQSGETSLVVEIEGGSVRAARLEGVNGAEEITGEIAEAVTGALVGLEYDELRLAEALQAVAEGPADHGKMTATLAALADGMRNGRFR